MKLHYCSICPHSRAIVAFCLANNIEFDAQKVDLFSGEQVPVLEDEGFVLTERYNNNNKKKIVFLTSNSHAILTYLASKFYVSDNWFPLNNTKAANKICK